jgi:hypothetical protein
MSIRTARSVAKRSHPSLAGNQSRSPGVLSRNGASMSDVMKAKGEDAPLLADLYAKAFSKTGFKKFSAPDKRGELIEWLKELADAGKLWFMRDNEGPVTLGHYEPEKGEVITIVTRDGAERLGNGEKMLGALLSMYPDLKVRPVTRSGEALAAKCGFAPDATDESVWVRPKSGSGAGASCHRGS